MKSFRLLGLTLIATSGIFVAGCETTGSNSSSGLSSTTRVDVFHEANKPTKAFKEIATLTDDGREEEQAEIEAKMVKKAQRMGGNAIIFAAPKQSGMEVAGPFSFAAKYTYIYKGTVIAYE